MNFRYRGRDAGGSIVEGQMEAENQGMALETLRQRGVVVLSMNSGGGAAVRTASGESMSLLDKLRRIGTVSGKTKMIFFQQLATMKSVCLMDVQAMIRFLIPVFLIKRV